MQRKHRAIEKEVEKKGEKRKEKQRSEGHKAEATKGILQSVAKSYRWSTLPPISASLSRPSTCKRPSVHTTITIWASLSLSLSRLMIFLFLLENWSWYVWMDLLAMSRSIVWIKDFVILAERGLIWACGRIIQNRNWIAILRDPTWDSTLILMYEQFYSGPDCNLMTMPPSM